MTKAELTGAAYLKLTGGYPTTDNSTWWEDVDILLAPAINYVMNADYFLQKRDEGEEKIIQPLFIQTYKNVAITYQSDIEKYTSVLPHRPLALPKNRAVSFVGTVLGQHFVPIEQGGLAMQGYYGGFKECQTSYSLEGKQITYENLDPLFADGGVAMVKMIVNVADLGDDEEILLPDGGELRVIDMLVEFFLGQRMLPKDYYNTNKDTQPTP